MGLDAEGVDGGGGVVLYWRCKEGGLWGVLEKCGESEGCESMSQWCWCGTPSLEGVGFLVVW